MLLPLIVPSVCLWHKLPLQSFILITQELLFPDLVQVPVAMFPRLSVQIPVQEQFEQFTTKVPPSELLLHPVPEFEPLHLPSVLLQGDVGVVVVLLLPPPLRSEPAGGLLLRGAHSR